MRARPIHAAVALVVGMVTATPLLAQLPSNSRYANGQRMPLSPRPPSGEPIAPFFEGWYKNDDGTFTFSFGYFNLNTEEELDIPVGPDNFIEPAELDGDQPTHFTASPRRNQGVFQVTVPGVPPSWVPPPVAETKVKPVGRGSVRVAPLTATEPVFS